MSKFVRLGCELFIPVSGIKEIRFIHDDAQGNGISIYWDSPSTLPFARLFGEDYKDFLLALSIVDERV